MSNKDLLNDCDKLFFLCMSKLYVLRWRDRGVSPILLGRDGGVLDNITDSLTLDNSGKRVWRVSCLLQVKDNVCIFRKKLADTNVYLYRLTKDSTFFEWLSKVVTPDGLTLSLVYITDMLLTLFLF